jgi:hypothetical protein
MKWQHDMQSATHTQRFTLDRPAAIEAIAAVWGLPADADAWRLDGFGDCLGSSVENLAGVVFAPGRRLLSGPGLEVRVYAVSDSHQSPVMVCLAGPRGPMLCKGIEDLATTLPEPWGASKELVLDALQTLLDVATELHQEAGSGFDPSEILDTNPGEPTATATDLLSLSH